MKPHGKTTPRVNLISHLGRTTFINQKYASLCPFSSVPSQIESKTPVAFPGKVSALSAMAFLLKLSADQEHEDARRA